MNRQDFTHYPYFMELIREVEQLFANIQKMERYSASAQCSHPLTCIARRISPQYLLICIFLSVYCFVAA
jgi:hypothetical protein